MAGMAGRKPVTPGPETARANQSLRDMVRPCPLTATTQNTTEKATSMTAERTGEYAVA